MKDSTAEHLLCPTLTKLRWKPCNACCVVCHVVMYLCDNNICAAVTDADVRRPRVFMVFCKRTSNGGATRWRHTQALGFVHMTEKTFN